MNKKEFISLLKSPAGLNKKGEEQLRKIVADYPFFNLAHVLLAKACYNQGNYNYEQQLKVAAIFSGNRKLLYQLIHKEETAEKHREMAMHEGADEQQENAVLSDDITAGTTHAAFDQEFTFADFKDIAHDVLLEDTAIAQDSVIMPKPDDAGVEDSSAEALSESLNAITDSTGESEALSVEASRESETLPAEAISESVISTTDSPAESETLSAEALTESEISSTDSPGGSEASHEIIIEEKEEISIPDPADKNQVEKEEEIREEQIPGAVEQKEEIYSIRNIAADEPEPETAVEKDYYFEWEDKKDLAESNLKEDKKQEEEFFLNPADFTITADMVTKEEKASGEEILWPPFVPIAEIFEEPPPKPEEEIPSFTFENALPGAEDKPEKNETEVFSTEQLTVENSIFNTFIDFNEEKEKPVDDSLLKMDPAQSWTIMEEKEEVSSDDHARWTAGSFNETEELITVPAEDYAVEDADPPTEPETQNVTSGEEEKDNYSMIDFMADEYVLSAGDEAIPVTGTEEESMQVVAETLSSELEEESENDLAGPEEFVSAADMEQDESPVKDSLPDISESELERLFSGSQWADRSEIKDPAFEETYQEQFWNLASDHDDLQPPRRAENVADSDEKIIGVTQQGEWQSDWLSAGEMIEDAVEKPGAIKKDSGSEAPGIFSESDQKPATHDRSADADLEVMFTGEDGSPVFDYGIEEHEVISNHHSTAGWLPEENMPEEITDQPAETASGPLPEEMVAATPIMLEAKEEIAGSSEPEKKNEKRSFSSWLKEKEKEKEKENLSMVSGTGFKEEKDKQKEVGKEGAVIALEKTVETSAPELAEQVSAEAEIADEILVSEFPAYDEEPVAADEEIGMEPVPDAIPEVENPVVEAAAEIEPVIVPPKKESRKKTIPQEEQKVGLVDKFIRETPSISRHKAEFYNPVNMANLSVTPDEDMVTETLAKIHLKQGNHLKAIKIYEKLWTFHPEKKAYYEEQIRKIRDLIE